MAEINQENDSDSVSQSISNHDEQCCKCDFKPKCKTSNLEPLSSWIVLVAIFMINILVAVPETSFGVFYEYLQDEYDTNNAAIGWIFAIYNTSASLIGMFLSPFMGYYGCRPVAIVCTSLLALGLCLTAVAPTITWFVVFFGIIGGMGAGGIFLVSGTIIQQCFTYNRGLATGISSLGFTAGTVLAPVFAEYVLQEYSLSGALLLHGSLFVQGIVFAAVLKTPRQFIGKYSPDIDLKHGSSNHSRVGSGVDSSSEKASMISEKDHCVEENGANCVVNHSCPSSREEADKDLTTKRSTMKKLLVDICDFSLVKYVPFDVMAGVFVFLTVSRTGLLTQTVSAAMYKGVPQKEAAYLFTIMGFSNLVSRSATSFILNIRWVNPVIYSTIGLVALSASSIMMIFASNYNMFVASMILMGTNEGLTNTAIPMVVVYTIGVDRIARSFAVLRIISLPASFVSAPFAAWLVDITGNYEACFAMVSICSVLCTVLSALVYILIKFKYHQTDGSNTHSDENVIDSNPEIVLDNKNVETEDNDANDNDTCTEVQVAR